MAFCEVSNLFISQDLKGTNEDSEWLCEALLMLLLLLLLLDADELVLVEVERRWRRVGGCLLVLVEHLC